jgi:hypothetical protein
METLDRPLPACMRIVERTRKQTCPHAMRFPKQFFSCAPPTSPSHRLLLAINVGLCCDIHAKEVASILRMLNNEMEGKAMCASMYVLFNGRERVAGSSIKTHGEGVL